MAEHDAFFARIPIPAVEITPDASVLRANARFAELVGCVPAVGSALSALLAPHDRDAFLVALVRAGKEGPARVPVSPGVGRNSVATHACISAPTSPTVVDPTLLVLFEPVDEEFADGGAAGVCDDAGRVLYASPAIRDRAAATEMMTDLYAPAAFDEYYCAVRSALLEGRVWRGRLEMIAAGGAVLPVEQEIAGRTGPGGEIRWIVASAARHVLDHPPVLESDVLHDPAAIAFSRNEIATRYAPMISLRTGSVVALEGVAVGPNDAAIDPSTGIADAVVLQTVRRVLSESAEWRRVWHRPPPLVLRVPDHATLTGVTVRQLAAALRAADSAPGGLVLVLGKGTVARAKLDELVAAGVRFILEGGTGGRSSESSGLVGYAVAPELSSRLANSAIAELVRAECRWAQSAGLTTYATGVQHAHTRERLAQLGCEVASGPAVMGWLTADAAAALLG